MAGSLSTELIGRGMTVTARRKTLEDAVIYLLGGWREEGGEAEVGGSDE